MRILLSFLLLSLSFAAHSECRFRPHVQKIYSFSGISSVVLKELGLLKNPVVKGISVFNPISKKDFSGRRYPGGIFLSRASLQEFGGGVVFYDESRELSQIIQPMSSIQGREIKTRGLTPLEAIDVVLKDLDAFLLDCSKAQTALREKGRTLSQRLLSSIPAQRTAVYYLGDGQNEKSPPLVIVNDGVVKWLVGQNKIKTYPSELAYVSWSQKVMSTLPKTTLHIIVTDSGADGKKGLERRGRFWVLTYPGSLVPGLTQIEAWNYFEEAASP